MRTTATVLGVVDDRARLACEAQVQCGACQGGRGCALRWFGGGPRGLEVVAPAAAEGELLRAGQVVELEVRDSELLRTTARACLPPLVGLLGGPLLVRFTGAGGEATELLAAAIGIGFGWAFARAWFRRSPPRLDVRIAATTHG